MWLFLLRFQILQESFEEEIEGDLELLKRGFSERKISEEIQKGIFDKINE